MAGGIETKVLLLGTSGAQFPFTAKKSITKWALCKGTLGTLRSAQCCMAEKGRLEGSFRHHLRAVHFSCLGSVLSYLIIKGGIQVH